MNFCPTTYLECYLDFNNLFHITVVPGCFLPIIFKKRLTIDCIEININMIIMQ